jgi:hypothetical protein
MKLQKAVVLAVISYGCETWTFTLREKHCLRVFENRVLRRISRPKREDVLRGWRKLHNEVLHNFYALPNVVSMMKRRRIRWTGHLDVM